MYIKQVLGSIMQKSYTTVGTTSFPKEKENEFRLIATLEMLSRIKVTERVMRNLVAAIAKWRMNNVEHGTNPLTIL